MLDYDSHWPYCILFMGHSHNNNRGFVLFQVTWVWKTIRWDQTALMELRSYCDDDVPCVHWFWFCPPQSTHTVIPDPIFQRLTNSEWMKLKSDRLTWWWIIPSLNLNVWLYFRIKFELQWTWSLVYSFWVHDNEWMSLNFGRVTGSILQLRLPLGRESVSRINSDWLSPSLFTDEPWSWVVLTLMLLQFDLKWFSWLSTRTCGLRQIRKSSGNGKKQLVLLQLLLQTQCESCWS